MKKLLKRTLSSCTASALVLSMILSCSTSTSDSSGGTTSTASETTTTSSSSSSSESSKTSAGSTVSDTDTGSTISAEKTDYSNADTTGTYINSTVSIIKASGGLNSAYVIFNQISQAKYSVSVDGIEIDEALIRNYDSYTENEYSESSGSWTEKSYQNIVRVDALGLKSGEHVISVSVKDSGTSPSTATVNVISHDRSGFAFTGTTTPGAYEADGTLKSGTKVIYVTNENWETVTLECYSNSAHTKTQTLTGVQSILDTSGYFKYNSDPLCIRILGTIDTTGFPSSSWKSSEEGLQVKGTSAYSKTPLTIEGIGNDAVLSGFGILCRNTGYVEISNLAVMNCADDCISLDTENEYSWVHNCDLFYGSTGGDADQAKGDGTIDLKGDTRFQTYSYNHFWDSGKSSLCGMKSETGPNYITYHHNWFDHSDSRHPRIRTMSVHVYNNYYDGNSKYGAGATSGASAFVESNYFRNIKDAIMISGQGTDSDGDGTFSGEDGAMIKAYNNFFTGNSNYASAGGNTSSTGQKLYFRTNKYDYTNNKERSETKTITESVGTQNTDGTWTIYDAAITKNSDATINDGIAECSFIKIESGASLKTDKYQISKGKTGFTISVPSSATKVIVKAKCGTSGASGTEKMLKINGTSYTVDLEADYTEYEASLSLTKDSEIEIANASSNNSLNVHEIKVIASAAWETTYTTGNDLTDIDAYEVDTRDEIISSSVLSHDGYAYNNFDTTVNLGLNNEPTEPEVAKSNTIKFAGRNNPDFVWNFDNSTEDTNSSVISSLKSAITSYTGKLSSVQGELIASTSSENESNSNTGSSDSNETSTGESSESTENTGTSENNEESSSVTTVTAPESWLATSSVPSWLSGISGQSGSSSSFTAFGLGTTTYYTVSKESSFSFTPTNACTIKIYIAGNNNTAGKGTVSAKIGETTIADAYSLPSRKDSTATPFEFTISESQAGNEITVTPTYESLLYKIELTVSE